MFLTSSAFPSHISNKIEPQLKIHDLIANLSLNQDTNRIYFIECLDSDDLMFLKGLHSELFPLKYSDKFFIKIFIKQIFFLGLKCSVIVDKKTQQFLIGFACYKILPAESQYLSSWTSIKQLFTHQKLCIHISTFGILQEFWGKGFAKLLLEQISQIAKQNTHIEYIKLEVIQYNQDAIQFYLKNGFKIMSTHPNYYFIDQYYDGLIMLKQIKNN